MLDRMAGRFRYGRMIAMADEPDNRMHEMPKKAKRNAAKKRLAKKPRVRRENEDDDGYDPYSDYMDKRVPEPLFERDPWK